jgi:predicted DCC family thiol-disulfide oxidoreductase YuxK
MQDVTTKLTILYDERCALCRRCRDWLLTQPCLVEVDLLPAGSVEAKERYGALPWLGSELIAVDDWGNVWVGPAAFIGALWATAKYRAWSYRMASPTLAPMAERFFYWVSKRRDRLSSWTSPEDADCSWCDGARRTGTAW